MSGGPSPGYEDGESAAVFLGEESMGDGGVSEPPRTRGPAPSLPQLNRLRIPTFAFTLRCLCCLVYEQTNTNTHLRTLDGRKSRCLAPAGWGRRGTES